MNFYNRFPGDYIKKTLDLSMVEDGAYTRLLDWMYANERQVPHDKRYVITRCQSATERKAVDAVLEQYFTRQEDDWGHERTLETIEEARPRIEAAKANGKKGGRPRKQKPEETQTGEKKKPTGFFKNNPEETQSESSPQPQPHKTNIVVASTEERPTTWEAWRSWFEKEQGIAHDPYSLQDRSKFRPLAQGWVNAGITTAQMRLAIDKAKREAKEHIAYLPSYVDRVLATMQQPPKAPTQADLNTLAAGYATGLYSAEFDPRPEPTQETIDVATRIIPS